MNGGEEGGGRESSAEHPSNRFGLLNFGEEGVEGWPLGLECFALGMMFRHHRERSLERMKKRNICSITSTYPFHANLETTYVDCQILTLA